MGSMVIELAQCHNGEWPRVVRAELKIAVAILTGFLVGALSAVALRMAQPDSAAITGGVPRQQGQAAIGGPFRLVDQNGHEFTQQDLLGKPSLIVFGYTADLTTAALNVISEALDDLGAKEDAVRVVLISLDWEGDGPQTLQTYLERFHPGIIGLSGSEKEVRNVASAYKIFLDRREAADGSVEIDHSRLMFALDSSGTYVAHLRMPASVPAVSSLLRRLLH